MRYLSVSCAWVLTLSPPPAGGGSVAPNDTFRRRRLRKSIRSRCDCVIDIQRENANKILINKVKPVKDNDKLVDNERRARSVFVFRFFIRAIPLPRRTPPPNAEMTTFFHRFELAERRKGNKMIFSRIKTCQRLSSEIPDVTALNRVNAAD